MTVLVTDGLFRKSVAAVRCLAAGGERVIAAERTYLAPALFSRDAAARVVHPDPILAPEAFVRRLAEILRVHRTRVLLPMEETTLLAILDRRNLLPRRCSLFSAPAEVIRSLSDKFEAMRVLEHGGFPVPRTALSPEELLPPTVVKPRSGSGARGVVRAESREDCVRAFERVTRDHGAAVVQEFVPGRGVGISLLLDRRGGTVAAFAHRRLRERPLCGGASTSRESIPLPPEALELGQVLHSAGFFGPVHVEFREDARDGILRPIEINPRYWGSLALAVHAGVPFPLLHARLARGEAPRPVLDYRIGARCRWLLFGEIQAAMALLRAGRLGESLEALSPRGPFDILSARDPGPAIARLFAPAAWLASPGLRRLLAPGRTESCPAERARIPGTLPA